MDGVGSARKGGRMAREIGVVAQGLTFSGRVGVEIGLVHDRLALGVYPIARVGIGLLILGNLDAWTLR